MRPPWRTSPAKASPGSEDAFAGAVPPLRRRLLLLGLIAGLALVGVAGGLARRQYDDARRTAVTNARARVILASAMIDSYFSGELATLSAIAQSPPVLAGDTGAMRAYFRRIGPPGRGPFAGGLGWADRHGVIRTSSSAATQGMDVSDRSYFRTAMTSGAPYVSEGLAARRTRRRIIVLAVPTRNARGDLTGVLAGALLLDGFRINSGSFDLGFDGLAVLDRSGRAVLAGFSRPRNAVLAHELQQRQVGLLSDARGLDGDPGHLVAFASAQLPGWTIAIDRPRSAVFAAAWRGLVLDLALLAAAAAVAFAAMGRLVLRYRREAEERNERAQQRGELSHALSAASLADEVGRGLATGLATAFPGAVSIVALEAGDRRSLALSAVGGDGSWPLSPEAAALVVSEVSMRSYESGFAFSVENALRLREELPGLHEALGGACRSLYAAPLRVRGALASGALCLLFADERSLGDADRAQVAWYADEASQALTRARSYEHEHAVAVSLQRSLLSQLLPEIDGVELLGHYEAGSAGLEVGGDWYDVVRCGDGTVQISVGDVAGHGLAAAVLMGQMRNAFRAYAYDHGSPAEVLRRMSRHVNGDALATAVCMKLDPYARELTYASAGHLPALMLAGEFPAVWRLDGASAPPLGIVEAHAVREATVDLPADATVVAYTDGLIERRDWSLDVGIDLLASVLAASSGATCDALASRIVHEVAGHVASGDDIAFLIIGCSGVPARMDIEISGDPTELAGLRRRLRRWLALRGLREDERENAVLSICEACNNAIEHGYQGLSGTIRLVIDHAEGALQIMIEDHGSWRPPVPNPERGLGIEIMRTVMDEATLEHEPGRTRVLLSQRLTR